MNEEFALTRKELTALIKRQPPKTCFYIHVHMDLPHATESHHLAISKTVKVSKRAALDIAADLISAEREARGWRIPGGIYSGTPGYVGFYIGG